jgi:hypothetical protein
VVTVKFTLPGSATLDAGIVVVSSVELTYVAAMFAPFRVTVEFAVNPVPFRVTVVAALIGPAFGEIDVSVGGGGFAIVTVTAFDTAGVEVELSTVIVALPTVVSRFAGTVAVMNSTP